MTRLPWSQLRQIFAGEWIEVVDSEWPWERPTPLWGVVRHHNSDRSQLLKQINQSGEVEGSVILFVGAAQSHVQHFDAVASL